MAFEADKVVVTLLADNAQFDAATKSSAASFSKSMGDIQKSGSAAEGAVGQFSSALKENRLGLNQSRIGMQEFQHIARGMSDQLAASGVSTQLFTSHIGELSEAIVLSGGSFGKLGAFLQGPWGIALTLAGTAIATLIGSQKKEGDTLDDLVNKLQEQHDKTLLSKEADEIWSKTLDGLIDKQNKLNDALAQRLTTQGATDQSNLQAARDQIASQQKALADERQRLTNLQNQRPGLVAQIQSPLTDPSSVAALTSQLDALDNRIAAAKLTIANIQKSIIGAQTTVTRESIILGQQQGAALVDLAVKSKQWADAYLSALTGIENANHGKLAPQTATITSGFEALKKAVDDAAAAGVDFAKDSNDFTHKAAELGDALRAGTIGPQQYAAAMKELARQLEETAKAAKVSGDPIKQFTAAVINAEGTGPNKMGSSASGIGQFLSSTWISEFNEVFPQFKNLSDDAKLALRDNKAVAEAIIENYARENAKFLQGFGATITAANLYLAHWFGAAGAKAILTAAPGTTAAQLFGGNSKTVTENRLQGLTVGDIEALAASRIGSGGASSSTLSGSEAVEAAVNDELKQQHDLWAKIDDDLASNLSKNVNISDELKTQGQLVPRIGVDELVDKAALSALDDYAREFTDQLNEAKQMGDQFVEDVLNPDNWKSFGDIAHTVLTDILRDLETIALLNPIENWLDGGHRLTIGSLLTIFGAGGSGSGTTDGFGSVDFSSLPPPKLAGGGFGIIGGMGGSDANLLSMNGQPVAWVSKGEGLAITPSNASAASPWSAGPSVLIVKVEPNDDRFDAYVAGIAGPMAAQAGTNGAFAGAGIARNNFARRQLHQLGSRG